MSPPSMLVALYLSRPSACRRSLSPPVSPLLVSLLSDDTRREEFPGHRPGIPSVCPVVQLPGRCVLEGPEWEEHRSGEHLSRRSPGAPGAAGGLRSAPGERREGTDG